MLAAVLALGGVAACGGDGTPAASDRPANSAVDAAGAATTAPAATAGAVSTDSATAGASLPAVTWAPEDEAFCQALQDVVDHNTAAPDFDITLPWAEFQQQFMSTGEASSGLYDDAIANAPEAVADDLQVISDYSDAMFAQAGAATSTEEFQALILELPTAEMSRARTELKGYVDTTCGLNLG